MTRQLLLLLFALLIGFAICIPQNILAAKKVAFLVGVNKYKKPGFRDLSYAERDVTEISKQLKKSGFDVTLILGKDATKTKLDSTVKELVKPLSKDDLILVMLTGHGVQRRNGDAFYCPYDAIAEDDETLFSLSKLLNTTLAQNVGKKLLLIDACRNDPDPGRGRSGGIQGKRITLPEDTAVMFSCKAGQQSFENDEIKHGVFTYCLLDALKGSAAFQGDVSWFSVVSYVNRRMASSEMRKYIPKNRIQTPIPAGGVPYTILARVEIAKPKVTVKPALKMKPEAPKPEVSKPKIPVADVKKPTLLVAPFTKKQADAKQIEWARYLKKDKSITNSIGMKFNLIPPGGFKMGSPDDEPGRRDNEYQHKVRITKPYYFGVTEVTQKQWKAVMGAKNWSGGGFAKEGDDYPASLIKWHDAQEFIEKLSRKDGVKYRLPTEAEWEYACRAGSESIYCFGGNEEILTDYAWFIKNARFVVEKYPHRSGMKLPNNFGLFDMHGNVSEWCSDSFSENFYRKSPLDNPENSALDSDVRVIRGGDWSNSSSFSRSAFRDSKSVSSESVLLMGLRLVRTP